MKTGIRSSAAIITNRVRLNPEVGGYGQDDRDSRRSVRLSGGGPETTSGMVHVMLVILLVLRLFLSVKFDPRTSAASITHGSISKRSTSKKIRDSISDKIGLFF